MSLTAVPFAVDLNPVHLIGRGISDTVANFGLSLITPWVLDGTKAALEEVAHMVSAATAPDVDSAWFTSEYWRVAALASLLTLPFIFAAALQALLRSEPGLILKVVFGYLPLALLGISVATPMVMLLLSATDEMCGIVSGAGVDGGSRFLAHTAVAIAGMNELGGSAFFAVTVGLFTLGAALLLTLELLIREASVYIVVLMLPLAFAAMVWPARKIWAVRLVEVLISLILAKFVIVSVLSLAGAAVGGGHGVAPMLTAMSLVLLSTLAPWALMRMLPFTEVAAAAAGSLRPETAGHLREAQALAGGVAGGVAGVIGGDPARTLPQRLRLDGSGGAMFDGPAEHDEADRTQDGLDDGGGRSGGGGVFDGGGLSDHGGAFGAAGGEAESGGADGGFADASRFTADDEPGSALAGADGPPTQPLTGISPALTAEAYSLPRLRMTPEHYHDWSDLDHGSDAGSDGLPAIAPATGAADLLDADDSDGGAG